MRFLKFNVCMNFYSTRANTAISYRAFLLQGCYDAIESWLSDNQNIMIGVGAAVLAVEVKITRPTSEIGLCYWLKHVLRCW